ncbi:MAG: trigger factor [Flavobacteriaceae bacterium]|nr:trigger factor [Flavobacteriaceae bacterium]
MNITRENIDALNAIVTVAIKKNDYSEKVQKILDDYRKQANIPGFRKGHVPMGLVKKQYGKAVLVDEVNKLIQDGLNKYLVEEKLDVLGNPLPKAQEDLDWDAEDFSFEFELGLAPEFSVDLKNKKAITQYNIVMDEKTVNDQIENIRKSYGKLIAQEEITVDSEITGVFANDENGIDNNTTFGLDKIKGKTNEKKFLGKKAGDTIKLKTKNLVNNENDLVNLLGLTPEDANGLEIELTFTINEINHRELADMDQEFFDKLFGPGVITTEKELQDRLKEDGQKQFSQQADQKLLNDVTDYLIENTKFDLPKTFLEKWLQVSGENPLTEDEAKAEFEKSEKGLRYQLIESKLMSENELKVEFENVKEHAKQMVKAQMAQFGQLNPSEEELENIAVRVLSNEEEVRRITSQLVSEQLLNLYKDKLNLKTKEVTYDDFVKEVYG